jgi:class 3 adenylate cyclase
MLGKMKITTILIPTKNTTTDKLNNLSILYADIVNFTPLSEKFEPPELVNILNKLFAKFDQKAKVNNFYKTR